MNIPKVKEMEEREEVDFIAGLREVEREVETLVFFHSWKQQVGWVGEV